MLKQKTVLIVDDSSAVRDYVRKIVQQHLNCKHIIETTSADETLHLLQSNQNIDWIFYDWNLCVSQNIQVLDFIRSHPRLADTPFIAFLYNSDKKYLSDIFSKGITDYIIKPFTLAILLLKISKIRTINERRREERIYIQRPVSINFQEQFSLDGLLANISITGCLIRVPNPLPSPISIYQHADIYIELQHCKLCFSGELVRIQNDQNNTTRDYLLLAFQYTHISSQDQTKLADFVASQQLPLPKSW